MICESYPGYLASWDEITGVRELLARAAGAKQEFGKWRASSARSCFTSGGRLSAVPFQAVGNQESKLQRLISIEARIAISVVTVRQVGLRNFPRTTDTLSYVFARHLQMHTARMGSFGAVNIEESLDLLQNEVEWTRSCIRSRP